MSGTSKPTSARPKQRGLSLHTRLKHFHNDNYSRSSSSASTASNSDSTDSDDKKPGHHDKLPRKTDVSLTDLKNRKKISASSIKQLGKKGNSDKTRSVLNAAKSVRLEASALSHSTGSTSTTTGTFGSSKSSSETASKKSTTPDTTIKTRISNAGEQPSELDIDKDKDSTATGIADAGGDTILNTEQGDRAQSVPSASVSLRPYAIAEESIIVQNRQSQRPSDGSQNFRHQPQNQSSIVPRPVPVIQPSPIVPYATQAKKVIKKVVSSSEEETSEEEEVGNHKNKNWQQNQHYQRQMQQQMNPYGMMGQQQQMMGAYPGQQAQFAYPPQYQSQQIYQQPPPTMPQQQGAQQMQMNQLGVMPMRSMAFDAPYVPLRTMIVPQEVSSDENEEEDNEDGKGPNPGNICCEESLEDGVEFSYKPRPNCRTEVTFTVEPKKQPQWLTMMNMGFRPVVNCTAPPCYLSPGNNPGMQICGGGMVNNCYSTPNYSQSQQQQGLPTIQQIQHSFGSQRQSNSQNHRHYQSQSQGQHSRGSSNGPKHSGSQASGHGSQVVSRNSAWLKELSLFQKKKNSEDSDDISIARTASDSV